MLVNLTLFLSFLPTLKQPSYGVAGFYGSSVRVQQRPRQEQNRDKTAIEIEQVLVANGNGAWANALDVAHPAGHLCHVGDQEGHFEGDGTREDGRPHGLDILYGATGSLTQESAGDVGMQIGSGETPKRFFDHNLLGLGRYMRVLARSRRWLPWSGGAAPERIRPCPRRSAPRPRCRWYLQYRLRGRVSSISPCVSCAE